MKLALRPVARRAAASRRFESSSSWNHLLRLHCGPLDCLVAALGAISATR